jgi:uncharacterized protein with ParB-like and HNH nuclease domain
MKGPIDATEVYLKDLFNDKFLFEIPNFQRQFAWEKENFEQLVEDIKDALETFGGNEPYFLGSTILWTKDEKDDGSGLYAVIDGQQRLTSLAILMACLRDLARKDKAKKNLQKCIYQEEDEYLETQECVRVRVRDREYGFFKQYILTDGGTEKLKDLSRLQLSEAKQHIAEAVDVFYDAFRNDEGIDEALVDKFIKYLLQRIVIVAVRTSSLASGFRLFNVINARGLPLSNADLLKSENLRVVSEKERKKYTQIWEDIEEEIGVDNLEMLISFIRSIYLKEKARKAIFEEFEDRIFKNSSDFKGKKFIEYVDTVASIYKRNVEECQISVQNSDKEIYYHNLVSIMRDFLPFNDWMAALVRFADKFGDESHFSDFVVSLERKIAVEWIRGLSFTERLTRIYRVIKLIDDSNDPTTVVYDAMFNLKSFQDEFANALDAINLYNKGRTRVPKYILLRMEMERHDNLHKKISYGGTITVEHILPQTPMDQYWLSRFDEATRLEWTNRLGNLVPLNGRKNSRARNKPFNEKVKDYFAKKSDFEVTNELMAVSEWNLANLQQRHDRLKSEALRIWIE